MRRRLLVRVQDLIFATFPALRSDAFGRLLWAQQISIVGSYAGTLGETVLLAALTHNDPTVAGIGSAAFTGPMLLFGLWAGQIAQKRSMAAILANTNTLAALNEIWLVITVATGTTRWWYLVVALGLRGAVNAFDLPAQQGALQMSVQREHRASAGALRNLASPAGALTGALLGTAAIDSSSVLRHGIIVCLLLNVASFYAVPRVLPGVGDPRAQADRAAPTIADQIRHIRATPQAWTTLLAVALVSVGTLQLGPVFFRIAPAARPLTWLNDAFAGGSLVGALVAAAAVGKMRSRAAAFAAVGAALGELVAAQVHSFPVALVALPGVGAMAFVFAAATRSVLTEVDPARAPFVLALYGIAQLGSATVGAPLGGWLAGRSAAEALRFGAGGCVAAGLAIVLAQRHSALDPRARALQNLLEPLAQASGSVRTVYLGAIDPKPTAHASLIRFATAVSRAFPDAPPRAVHAFYPFVHESAREVADRYNAQHGDPPAARFIVVIDDSFRSLPAFVVGLEGSVNVLYVARALNRSEPQIAFMRLSLGAVVIFDDLAVSDGLPGDETDPTAQALNRYFRAQRLNLKSLADGRGAYMVVTERILATIRQREQEWLREQHWPDLVAEELVLACRDPEVPHFPDGWSARHVARRAVRRDRRLTEPETLHTLRSLVDASRCTQPRPDWFRPTWVEITLALARLEARAQGAQALVEPSPPPPSRLWFLGLPVRRPRRLQRG